MQPSDTQLKRFEPMIPADRTLTAQPALCPAGPSVMLKGGPQPNKIGLYLVH